MRAFVIAFAALAAACSSSGSGNDSTSPEVRLEARSIFEQRCTPCHGAMGRGDGPASASLSPHPRNFTDKAWQAGVTDDHIMQIIQYGGAAVGKSPNMPANPDLQAKPLVVQALARKIRGFGQ